MIIRELVTKLGLEVDNSDFQRFDDNIGMLKNKVGDIGKSLDNVANSFIGTGTRMTAFLSLPIAILGGFAVKAASDAEEVQNKFNQVFKGIEKDANSFAMTFSESVGRSNDKVQEGLSAFQSFFVGLRATKKEAFELSKELQTLAIDFGSFNNLSDEESLQRFISAMSGSSEVVDRFGINLKQANLELKLQELGLADNVQNATEMQKAIARLSIIREALGAQGAIGDAVRTLGDFANRTRQTRALIRSLAIDFGKILIPPINKFLGVLNDVIKWLKGFSPAAKKFIVVVAGMAATIGPVLIAMGTMIKMIVFLKQSLLILKTTMFISAGATTTFNFALLTIPLIIIAVVAAIALLIDEIDTWIAGGDSYIGDLLGPWETWKDNMLEFFTMVKNGFKDLLTGDIDELIRKGKLLTKTFDFFTAEAVSKIPGKIGKGIQDILFPYGSTPEESIANKNLFLGRNPDYRGFSIDRNLVPNGSSISIGDINTSVNVAGGSDSSAIDIGEAVSREIKKVIDDTVKSNQ